MKIVKALLVVMSLALLLPVSVFAADSMYMRISYVAGDVQVQTPDADEWGFASVNAPLGEGDQVWVPQGGRAELQLSSGSFIRLDQNSALQILSLEDGSTQFHLSQGSAYVVFDIAKKGGVIQVDTPDASTRAYKRAIFRIDVSAQYTDVAVYRGSVETENGVGSIKIRKNQMLTLAQDSDGEVAPMGPADEWEQWNKNRNDRMSEIADGGSRYLPEELRSYAADLDSSGKWVRVPEYGYVWTPAIAVGIDWAPYRDGRWVWRHGEYIWVGHEAWGWAPYHYGRWAHVPRVGWCWVPPSKGQVYWGPGYVGWVRTEEYVAWVPLAPREIYYGRGNYGRHSVNITKVNVNQVNITNVYKNIHINNGVTVVNRNTFNSATPAFVNINKNDLQRKIFVKSNFVAGTHDIKPGKASFFDMVKPGARVHQPPQAVRNVMVRDLKQARPFTKDAARSVMNPGVKPALLPVNTITKPREPGKERPIMQPIGVTPKGPVAIPERVRTPRTIELGAKEQKRPIEQPKGQPVEKDKGRIMTPIGTPGSSPVIKDDRPGVIPDRRITGPQGTMPTRAPEQKTIEQRAIEQKKIEQRIKEQKTIEQPKGQPAEKDKGRIMTPIGTPGGSPAVKDDKPAAKPDRRITGPQGTMPTRAPEQKTIEQRAIEQKKIEQGIKEQKTIEQPKGQPVEKDKGRIMTPIGTPGGSPAVKDVRPAVKPDRRTTGTEGTPSPRTIEQPKSQPLSQPQGQAAEKDKGRSVTPIGSPAIKDDKPVVKPPVKPVDKVKPVVVPPDSKPKDAKTEEKKKKDDDTEGVMAPIGVQRKAR
ncbi:MAG: hypothetical protein C0402_10880 [Thermodesulfovibrio sp.]|nr:hypothetical protein [Thermodesulfovibrio sp.]